MWKIFSVDSVLAITLEPMRTPTIKAPCFQKPVLVTKRLEIQTTAIELNETKGIEVLDAGWTTLIYTSKTNIRARIGPDVELWGAEHGSETS